MAFTLSDLKSEVLRRSVRDQAGGKFDTAAVNAINLSMWRIARDAKWRTLRRTASFNTASTYSTGGSTATLNNGSSSFSISDALLITNDIKVGQYIKFNGSVIYFKIATITSETAGTLNQVWDGTSTTSAAWSVMPQEEYVLPIQIGHGCFFWHRKYGMPKVMKYVPSFDFYSAGVLDILTNIPIAYRMWGVGASLEEIRNPSTITVVSSSGSDTAVPLTIFGTVAGYPDYETITVTGTTPVAGVKTFSQVERVVKNQNTVGRITLTTTTNPQTISVLPVGNTTTGPMYTRIQVYPLPNSVFPIYVNYYKLPYQLVNSGDVPELGEDFSEAIILLSCAKMKAEQNLAQDAQNFMAMYRDEINSLKSTNIDKIDFKAVLKHAGDEDVDTFTGGLRFAQIGGSGQYGGSWSP